MDTNPALTEDWSLPMVLETTTSDWIHEIEEIEFLNPKNNIVFDLRNLLIECKALLHEESQNKQIVWVLELGDPLFIKTSKNNLQIVFEHILNNAIQYNHKGGKVIIKVREDKDFILVSIEDSGVGIEPEKLKTIFEIHSNQKNPYGISMGLAICKEWMESIGGFIEIESKLGIGTRVCLGIPKS